MSPRQQPTSTRRKNEGTADSAVGHLTLTTWQDVAVSQTEDGIKAILGNPVMINAYKEGIPGDGKPFSEGSIDCKNRVVKKKSSVSPYFLEVPDTLKSVSFIAKDSKRFPDTSGWEPSFCVTQRLTRSSLMGAMPHSGRKFVTSAIRL